ncbi:MAG TPA: alpha/beta hydrolase [Bryobacteraceae bacterium]|nr:alpha/beta hydrolase [Bryobacteraceae bacterium]
MPSQLRARLGGVLAGLVLILLVLMAVGAGYEQFARLRERARYPQVGRSVDVGGRSLNLACAGEGGPAVILESDAMSPGYSWVFIQREIARFTRACWYDRAGYGWSDPAPAPHTSMASMRDLHKLLDRAGVAPPYVLVGSGFGTLNVRVYNRLFPREVAGMVLVDPIVEQAERLGIAARIPFHLGYPPDLVLRTVNGIGLIRLMPGRRFATTPKGLTGEELNTLAGLERMPGLRAAFLAEEGFSASLVEARSAGGLGDRPLVVLRSEEATEATSGTEAGQPILASLSTQGHEVIVKDSLHHIQSEAPDAVVSNVRAVVGQLRHQP